MDYLYFVITLVCIYAILALSMNLLTGYTGLLSMAQGALYGVGAYVAALLAVATGANFLVATAAAALGTGAVGVLMAVPTLRMMGDYFILAFLGFQLVITNVMQNWVAVTRGPYGVTGIPRPTIFGVRFVANASFLVLSLLLAALAFFITWRILRSPFGRSLKALREDTVVAEALGKNVTYYRLWAAGISGMLAGISGSLYAFFINYIDPSAFTIETSIYVLVAAFLGGNGNIWGSAAGAGVLVLLPEAVRFVGLPSQIAGPIQQMVYGIVLLMVMVFRPRGLMGEFELR